MMAINGDVLKNFIYLFIYLLIFFRLIVDQGVCLRVREFLWLSIF